ncbi:MAG: BsuBI/PstI family type II restriction endonuclease [Roseiflexaceae bacterium]
MGFPRQQQNERSGLTLLALLDLKPDDPWSAAQAPLCGITPMMEFFAQYYQKLYKPNTRETVRRQTIHQFLDTGIITINPDNPTRPTNSPHAVYQIEPAVLDVIRSYTSDVWTKKLYIYRANRESLADQYKQKRNLVRIPLQLPGGGELSLSPGGQNELIERIMHEFAPRFVPNGEVLYTGDTDRKFAYFAEQRAIALGIRVDQHGKMPDVVLFDTKRNWLILIEAVTSHGPIDPKRHQDLSQLFESALPGLVFVTAFLTKSALKEYPGAIAWETEVWVADSSDHRIHFNGERFLGPYSE